MVATKAILLRDIQGIKTEVTSAVKKFFRGTSHSTINVLRGELLVESPQDSQPFNYQLHRDSTIYLNCEAGDVAILGTDEFLLLEAIAKPGDRWWTFRNKIDWATTLKEGSKVYVTIPGDNPLVEKRAEAVVHYKGKIGNQPGVFFGTELLEQSHREAKTGTTDGTFQGQRYFIGCGLFVSLLKISSPAVESRKPKQEASLHMQPKVEVDSPSEEMVKLSDLLSPRYMKLLHDNKELRSRIESVQAENEQLNQVRREFQLEVKELTNELENRNAEIQRNADAIQNKDEVIRKKDRQIADLQVDKDELIRKKDRQIADLQQQLDTETRQKQFTQIQPLSRDDSWKVSRAEIQRIRKKQIGSGAWGVVYSAKFRGEDVAIKTAHREIFHQSTVELLKREVTIMSQIQHPNLVRFIAAVWDDAVDRKIDTPIIISELMDMNLRSAYEQRIDLSDSLISIFCDVAYALHYLHQHRQPIIHRDISAPNVLLKSSSGSYRAKVSDFGSANLVKQSKTAGAGAIVYCAPEMFPHEDISVPPQPQTTKVDVFSYGILLLEVLSKEMPTQETRYNMLQKIGSQKNTMYELIVHCTKPSPSDRPTMADILNKLNKADVTFHTKPVPGANEKPKILEEQAKPAAKEHPTVIFAQQEMEVSHNLGVGSLIQLPTADGCIKYGTIKWIGLIPKVHGEIAGIELDEFMDGCGDGKFEATGQKFFSCPYGRGLYYPLNKLRPDQRYAALVATDGNPLRNVSAEELRDSAVPSVDLYIGVKKGIQGHQNSCYLDATLFGLFALTSEFDDLFLRTQSDQSPIGTILWKNIVNPLREWKNAIVKYECVMRLREQLDQLGKMKGITLDEREFLNLMFKHTLHVEPFIGIRRPYGVEKEYFVQLFLEMDGSQKSPSIGDLLEKMFTEQHISFTEIPKKLLIQVPRFGKKFQNVIPAKTINVGAIVDVTTSCFNCGAVNARKYCLLCETEFGKNRNYCDRCLEITHGHSDRVNHHDHVMLCKEAANVKAMADLELLSVICIETSHYVCFTRQEDRWIFFDSMAERVYDKYNLPKVVDCTALLNDWVYPYDGDLSRLLNTPPRELPEYVRRFTQDIYMCVYIQPDAAMYS